MTSGRPGVAPRTSYQSVTPPFVNVLPGPLRAAGCACAMLARDKATSAAVRRRVCRITASIRVGLETATCVAPARECSARLGEGRAAALHRDEPFQLKSNRPGSLSVTRAVDPQASKRRYFAGTNVSDTEFMQ